MSEKDILVKIHDLIVDIKKILILAETDKAKSDSLKRQINELNYTTDEHVSTKNIDG